MPDNAIKIVSQEGIVITTQNKGSAIPITNTTAHCKSNLNYKLHTYECKNS